MINFKDIRTDDTFKLDITAEFESAHTNMIKMKTLIDKICNLTKFFSIFFSSLFKLLMTRNID